MLYQQWLLCTLSLELQWETAHQMPKISKIQQIIFLLIILRVITHMSYLSSYILVQDCDMSDKIPYFSQWHGQLIQIQMHLTRPSLRIYHANKTQYKNSSTIWCQIYNYEVNIIYGNYIAMVLPHIFSNYSYIKTFRSLFANWTSWNSTIGESISILPYYLNIINVLIYSLVQSIFISVYSIAAI